MLYSASRCAVLDCAAHSVQASSALHVTHTALRRLGLDLQPYTLPQHLTPTLPLASM